MDIRHRAYAYITNGSRLLLFTHPEAPEAGIQVPAGTIEAGETPEDAVMREGREETGLPQLRLERFLAQDTRDMRDWGRDEVAVPLVLSLVCRRANEGNLAPWGVRGGRICHPSLRLLLGGGESASRTHGQQWGQDRAAAGIDGNSQEGRPSVTPEIGRACC